MKTHWSAAFCLIMVLLLSLGGMTSAALPAATGPQELQVTECDNGRAVDLDQVLVLHLESNPSTGYGCQVQCVGSGWVLRFDAEGKRFEFLKSTGQCH